MLSITNPIVHRALAPISRECRKKRSARASAMPFVTFYARRKFVIYQLVISARRMHNTRDNRNVRCTVSQLPNCMFNVLSLESSPSALGYVIVAREIIYYAPFRRGRSVTVWSFCEAATRKNHHHRSSSTSACVCFWAWSVFSAAFVEESATQQVIFSFSKFKPMWVLLVGETHQKFRIIIIDNGAEDFRAPKFHHLSKLGARHSFPLCANVIAPRRQWTE